MLDRVTITGADDKTDIEAMMDLSAEFPFVEWGILCSLTRESGHRYPSRAWQERLLAYVGPLYINLSMHVCGAWARNIFAGTVDWRELPPVRQRAQRIQINGTPGHIATWDLGSRQCIVQHPRATDFMYAGIQDGFNVAPLFDASGGDGKSDWSAWADIPLPYVGYAGGIGPDNIGDALTLIDGIRSRPFWIDMEGRVRDEDDRLDMHKVRRVLETCAPLVCNTVSRP